MCSCPIDIAHHGAPRDGTCLASAVLCTLDQLAHVLLEEVGTVEVLSPVLATGVRARMQGIVPQVGK